MLRNKFSTFIIIAKIIWLIWEKGPNELGIATKLGESKPIL